MEISSAVVPSDLAKTNVALVVRYVGQLNPAKVQAILKQRIKRSVETFSRVAHAAQRPGEDPKRTAFRPGVDVVPYAGRVFDEKEVEAAVAATLDFWLTLGKEGEAFEAELASYLGVRRSILTNSGSSANLLALSALTSHKLPEERRIRRGDEVITCAAGFPTTVAPILQNGAVPVFLDNDPITGNADLSRLEDAYVPGKTKAVMMAHALGNPFDLGTILAFCRKYNLWLIEDNCDALGSTYSMPEPLARSLGLDHLLRIAEKGDHPLICLEPNGSAGETRMLTAPTGTWGDLSTQSFYPPHHLTMGEGGAVNIVKDMKLKVLVESFRDWGRDCWCASGMDNTCRKRFGWQLGELPEGYDHKYIYSHLGYNLKPLDPQAAIGRVQLQKLPAFTKARRSNWEALRRGLAGLEDYFQFSLPTHATAWCPPGSASPENKRESGNGVEDGSCFLWEASSGAAPYPSMGEPWAKRSRPSWFGFMMLVRPDAPFSRTDFVQYLDACKIGNRMLFGGNLVRQPAFVQLRRDNPQAFRILGPDPASSSALPGADRIMNEAVFIGVYPGLTRKQIDYMIDSIRRFVRERAATAAAVRGEELGVDSDR
ncbi:MAG: lipopolysaccharide biosynthesis protein RfbH [Candidatus Methylacidiphilales bacterium]